MVRSAVYGLLVFMCLCAGQVACTAGDGGIKGLNIGSGWTRLDAKEEKELGAWMFIRQKPEMLLAYVVWEQADETDPEKARENLARLIESLAPGAKTFWRDTFCGMAVRSAHVVDSDTTPMVEHFSCFWDGKTIRTIGFRFNGKDVLKWPVWCERFLSGWLYFGQKVHVDQALDAAISLQHIVGVSPKNSLDAFLTPGVVRKLTAFNDVLYSKPPSLGWKTLVAQSLVVPAGITGRLQKTVYYHPWSDVALVLFWDIEGEKTVAVDALLVDGEYYRKGKIFGAKGAVAPWRLVDFPPLEILTITAGTVKAIQFKSLTRLAALYEYPDFYRKQHTQAGLKFLSYFLNIAQFYEDPQTGKVVLGFLERCTQKDKTLLDEYTTPQTREAVGVLLDADSNYIAALSPRAYFKTAANTVFVLLAGQSASSFAALEFEPGGGDVPVRVFLLNFDSAVVRIKEAK